MEKKFIDLAPKYLGNALPLKSILGIVMFVLTLIILIFMKSNELTITITLFLMSTSVTNNAHKNFAKTLHLFIFSIPSMRLQFNYTMVKYWQNIFEVVRIL